MPDNSAASEVQSKVNDVINGLSALVGSRRKQHTLEERMQFYRVPGVSIAVLRQGELEWARGFGVCEKDQRKVDPETLFQAASISKPVTALLVMQLVEKGMLNLDEDVNHSLRSWKLPENEFTAKEKITLRRLLSHSAGTTVHGFAGYEPGKPIPTLQQVLDGEPPANSKPVRVQRKPGMKFAYSGGGTTIVQQVCMDVTGMPFDKLMSDYVLQPLGMAHSAYAQPLPPEKMVNFARGHKQDSSIFPGGFHIYPELAAAGLWTTPTDLLKVVAEIRQAVKGKGKLLKTETARQVLTRQITKDFSTAHFMLPTNWGLGFDLRIRPSETYFGHSGGNAGFACEMLGLLERGEGAVVMTNAPLGTMLWLELFERIAEVYGWPDCRPAVHFSVKHLPVMAMLYATYMRLKWSRR